MLVEPKVLSRLPQWVYKARDAIEFSRDVPRNSPVSSVVHFAMGAGGAAAVTIGGAQLVADRPDPSDPTAWDRDAWLHTSRAVTTAAGAFTVLITAGMQFSTPQHVPLARGVNPLYFLGVGAFAWSNFALPKIQKSYAE